MRVIAGALKGRRFSPPKSNKQLRPMTDRVREATFAWLEQHTGGLDGAAVLDLYSGSGSLGIEALSRGAQFVCFIEANREFAEVLKRSLVELGISESSMVLAEKVERAIGRLRERLGAQKPTLGGAFHLIFVDPPYREHPGTSVLRMLAHEKLVREGTYVVMESDQGTSLPDEEEYVESGLGIIRVLSKRYGGTMLSVYRYRTAGTL